MDTSERKMVVPTPTSSTDIKSVCVFCGAGNGGDPIYAKEAYGKKKL
jgi:NAD(P)H-hydrate repair Nnr-like enzyme with NAD(P)H-hydrate epimerase domain